ncbi:hypothetical protein [Streptomyces sp. NPDC049949]|uniref:hypothetical protein n=1 Tax=Streptomyces sp. NPDC049949 TaxID=3154627 RepID=UPI00341C4CF6
MLMAAGFPMVPSGAAVGLAQVRSAWRMVWTTLPSEVTAVSCSSPSTLAAATDLAVMVPGGPLSSPKGSQLRSALRMVWRSLPSFPGATTWLLPSMPAIALVRTPPMSPAFDWTSTKPVQAPSARRAPW